MTKTWYRICLLALGVLMVVTGCAQGEVGNKVDVNAILNGEDLAASSASNPIRIADDQTAELTLALTNVSDAPVTVRYVRFEGEVIDMIFLTYDTALSVPLAPGESRTLPPVLLDFFDLGGQASGYLRGAVQLYDEQRDPIGSQPLFLDARGDGLSTLELFNLLLLAGTVLGAAWNLLRLSQRRLPANRFVRALRFLAVGAGAGLTLAVAFSTLRIWPLSTLWWLLFTIVGAIVGYVIGLLLPGSEGDDIDLLDEEDLLEELVLEHDEALVGAGAVGAGSSVSTRSTTKMRNKPATTAARATSATAAPAGAAKITTDLPPKTPPSAGDAKKTVAKSATSARDPRETVKKTVAKSATSAGDPRETVKKTVAKSAGDAKKTVEKAVAEAAGDPRETVKKTIPKAPGSGARETIAKPSAADTPSSAKDTLPDDN